MTSCNRQRYFSYDGEFYTGTFPMSWLVQQVPGTGPKDCEKCAKHGKWNRVFIGYCMNCSYHVYNGTRGRGFETAGNETSCQELAVFKSAFDTYLKGVELDDIGYKYIMDSDDDDEDEVSIKHEKKFNKGTVISYDAETGNGIIEDHIDGHQIQVQKSNILVKDKSIVAHLYRGEHVQYILERGAATNVTGLQSKTGLFVCELGPSKYV